MKKFCIVFGLLIIIIVTAAVTAGSAAETEYLRMHAIVDYLMPLAASCESKEEAMAALKKAIPAIEAVADEVLAENGFSYTAHAEVRREEFPTRVYEDVTLEAGMYDALIVELGTGEGENWWCVLYPPMCFSGEATGENIVFRSRIAEIIRSFFAD